MADAQAQFSARVNPIDAIGARPSADVCRVRDVLMWTTTDAEVSGEDLHAHLPIAFPLADLDPSFSGAQPVELGRGLRIDRLSDDDAELVMNACTPRGHFFAPIRQFGQRYSFIRDVALDEWRARPFRWDETGEIGDALLLSRLVRDHSQSTMFAARIADFADGEQTVVYTLPSEGKSVFRLHSDRDWLDPDEGAELRELLRAYWAIGESALPARVQRAIFRVEYASWIRWSDLALPVLVSGLEALLKTDRGQATHQFKARVSALATDLGLDGMTAEFCERMCDARSQSVHGEHVRLFTSGPAQQQAAEEGAHEGPLTDAQRSAIRDIARVQDVLRRTVRRCIEEDDFRGTFESEDSIRNRWPM